MLATESRNSMLAALAKRIEGDIVSRGLQPGDRYRTAAEVGLMLGVSAATAHRAMNLLVRGRLLTRKQGRGTFIGTGVGARAKLRPRVRVVYVLLAEEQRGVSSIQLEDLIDAVRSRIHDTNVQFCFMPPDGSGVEYVREIIGAAQTAGHFAGAIPISCSREVYRYLAEAGGPTVILGSPYSHQNHLASVDIDYRHAGFLLAQHLISRDHRRIGLLTTGGGRPGDNALYDGISDAFTRAGLPHNALILRMFPHDFETFRAQARELLEQTDRPTGIMCRSDRMVSVVASAAAELGLALPKDVELVFQSQANPGVDRLPYARVQPRLSFQQISELVADMLARLVAGETLADKRVVIPVEMHRPE